MVRMPAGTGLDRPAPDRPAARPGAGQAVEPARAGGHASSPTNCSSWRSVRHSTTSSQWTAYSPTMESPESQ